MPFIVKESYRENQEGVLLNLSIGVKGKVKKNKIQIPAYLLDKEIKDKSLMLNFEEVKEIRTRVGLNATAEGAILSAYSYFTQAGRLALIQNK